MAKDLDRRIGKTADHRNQRLGSSASRPGWSRLYRHRCQPPRRDGLRRPGSFARLRVHPQRHRLRVERRRRRRPGSRERMGRSARRRLPRRRNLLSQRRRRHFHRRAMVAYFSNLLRCAKIAEEYLPNTRPIRFSPSPRCQISALSAAVNLRTCLMGHLTSSKVK